MAFHFFAPKILGSVCIGSGVVGGGGVIYWYQMPRTWKELLTKEGFIFLSSDEDYKAMFNDQKSNSDWTTDNDLNGATDGNVKNKTETYCGKLNNSLPGPSDTNYENTKRKLIAFCTSGGIKTVKARLIQNKKKDWIDNDTAGDKWKPIFAIYRYEPKFIDWLKKDSGDVNLSETSSVDEWQKLKTACTNLLAKQYRELDDNKYFEYASWWCTDLGYTTVNDRIKTDTTWSQENNGENIKSKWENTEKVTSQIRTDLSKDSSYTLTDSEYKQWCDDQLKKELKENSYYRDKYVMIKSVCRSTTP